MDRVSQDYQLKQKELITLGVIAQHNTLSARELRRALSLRDPAELESWLGRLPDEKLALSKGRTKGTEYFVNPDLLRKVGFRGKTTLRQIEDHRLRELIREDLKAFPNSAIGSIRERVGKEIPASKIRRAIRALVREKTVIPKGERRGRKYSVQK
jgi:ATP-dependent DNA helicase RecG